MENLDKNFLKILELSRDIIYMVELEPELKMLYINSVVTEKLGISVEENYKYPNMAMGSAHRDDLGKFQAKVSDELDYSKPLEVRYRHVNGDYIWFEEYIIPIYDNMQKLIALVGFCRDIQERKLKEAELKNLIFTDCLTGIKNRSFFEREIKKLESNTNTSLGMIICDLDDLKYINDNYGHLTGDKLLRDFGSILSQFKDKYIATSRIGGDEFAVLIKGQSLTVVEKLCFQLRKKIDIYNLANKDTPINVSIGVSFCQKSIGMASKVYSLADQKMYENKTRTKNNVLHCTKVGIVPSKSTSI